MEPRLFITLTTDEGKELEPLLNGQTDGILSAIRGILTGKGILKTTTQLLKLLPSKDAGKGGGEVECWALAPKPSPS